MKKNNTILFLKITGALFCVFLVLSFVNLSLPNKSLDNQNVIVLCDDKKVFPSSGDIIKSLDDEVVVCVHSFPIIAKTAIGARQHIRGLSGLTELSDGEGMLFVFDKSDKYGFWMKDMFFSIDILWIDEEGKVVHIKENATPESYPEVFKPDIPARFVLEVKAGFVKEEEIGLGTELFIN